MTKQTFILLFLFVGLSSSFGQKKKNEKPQIKLSGYVGAETIYDNRGVLAVGGGNILLYPLPEKLDANGEDLNGSGRLSFFGMTSRIRVATTPYDFLGGKITSFIEFDFAASTVGQKITSRLRHAAIRFDRKKSTVIVGQYWHPMFVPGYNPTTGSVDGGAMIMAFARSPQIRYIHRFNDDFRFSLIASSQSDSGSIGPNGKSTQYMQDAIIPELNGHIELGNAQKFVLGAVGGMKTLKPHTVNAKGNKSKETLTTFHAMAYTKIRTDKVDCKLQAFYVQNGTELLMLGGYGVANVEQKTGNYEYAPLSTYSFWGEVNTRLDSSFNFGLFGGFSENLGADKEIKTFYTRGVDIEKIVRIAPRVVYTKDALKVSLELNQTYAYYGTPDAKGLVSNSKSIGSSRIQLYVRYFF